MKNRGLMVSWRSKWGESKKGAEEHNMQGKTYPQPSQPAPTRQLREEAKKGSNAIPV